MCLCFDANLPKMHGCSRNCHDNPLVLCPHRFDFKVNITYCNGKHFYGVSDLNILYHFLDHIREGLRRGNLTSETICSIFTRDTDFLKDAEAEWGRRARQGEELVFGNKFVQCEEIIIHAHLVDCKNYGTSGHDNLKCIIYKMNKFFNNTKKA